jgi:hypothetical protein
VIITLVQHRRVAIFILPIVVEFGKLNVKIFIAKQFQHSRKHRQQQQQSTAFNGVVIVTALETGQRQLLGK